MAKLNGLLVLPPAPVANNVVGMPVVFVMLDVLLNVVPFVMSTALGCQLPCVVESTTGPPAFSSVTACVWPTLEASKVMGTCSPTSYLANCTGLMSCRLCEALLACA